MLDALPAELAPRSPESLRRAGIAAIGTALPRSVVGSDEIEARLGVAPGWIEQRTGIRERRIAGEGDSLTALGADAALRALGAAGVAAESLEMVLVATFTPDRLLPNAAPMIADAIGARGAFACDIGAACTGFLSAVSLAVGQIESGRAEHVLVVGADLTSRMTDRGDRKTAGLFADGAGAVVLRPTRADGAGAIESIVLHSDARQADCIVVERDERLIRMRGQDTFRAAVDALSDVTLEVLAAEQARIDEIDLFVYHQANARITAAVGERLGLPADRVIDCIGELGNTSAATLPLALAEAGRAGRLQPGARVLLAAFGAGFVWGGALLRWDGELG